MMRILLFLATNIAVLLVASITLRLLGVEGYLRGQGINFNGNDFLVLARMTPEQARRARRRENILVDALHP